MGWLLGITVGDPAALFTQVRLVVYCARLLTLPGAMTSFTMALTLEDKVATAAVKGPFVAPVEVEVDSTLLLPAEMTL